MEAISCLVPELWSKMDCGCGTQPFEKMQHFYVVTINLNASIYYHVESQSSRAGVHNSLLYSARPCNTLVQKSELSWKKTCTDKITFNLNSIIAESASFLLSGSHFTIENMLKIKLSYL